MDPQEYEHYVASIYEQEGYKTTVTPYSGDGGIDIIAKKEGKKIAIQCKNYGHTCRKVNAQMIRELYGAAHEQDCDGMVLVTDGYLLPEAQETAKKLNVRIRNILPSISIGNCTEDANREEGNTSSGDTEILLSKLAAIGTFAEVYRKIKALEGQKVYLLGQSDKYNIIKSFDNSGMKRISKNGKLSNKKVPIEAFRYAYNQLRENGEVTRDEINQKFPERCSSIVSAVIARVLPVEVITSPEICLKVNI